MREELKTTEELKTEEPENEWVYTKSGLKYSKYRHERWGLFWRSFEQPEGMSLEEALAEMPCDPPQFARPD